MVKCAGNIAIHADTTLDSALSGLLRICKRIFHELKRSALLQHALLPRCRPLTSVKYDMLPGRVEPTLEREPVAAGLHGGIASDSCRRTDGYACQLSSVRSPVVHAISSTSGSPLTAVVRVVRWCPMPALLLSMQYPPTCEEACALIREQTVCVLLNRLVFLYILKIYKK